MDEKLLGETLKKHRRSLGLTQKEAAEKTGVSLKTYADYENGNRIPQTKATYYLLAQALKCDVETLIKYDNRFNSKSAAMGIAAATGMMSLCSPFIAPAIALSGMLLSKQVNKNVLNKKLEEELEKDDFAQNLSSIQKQFKALSTGILCSSLSKLGVSFSIHETNSYDLGLIIKDQYITRWYFDFWSDTLDINDNDTISIDIKARMMLSKYMLQPKNKYKKVSVVVDSIELFNALLLYKEKNSYQGNLSIILVDSKKVAVTIEQYLAYYTKELVDKLPSFK